MSEKIKILNVYKTYGRRKTKTKALRGISITLPDKGLIVINGKSGSGKTTLLNILCGLDKMDGGSVFIDGEDVAGLSEKRWIDIRNNKIGIVFQDDNLLDEKTVSYNLKLVLEMLDIPQEEQDDRIIKALELLGIGEERDKRVNELSAGQKQRVSIARAYIKEPDIILADEATANLDPKNTEAILKLFDKISKKCLVILVSHNKYAVEKYADRIITMEDGVIIHDDDNLYKKSIYQNYIVRGIGLPDEGIGVKEFDFGDYISKINESAPDEIKVELDLKQVCNIENQECASIKEIHARRKIGLFKSILRGRGCYCNSIKKTFLTGAIVVFLLTIAMMVVIINQNDYIDEAAECLKNEGINCLEFMGVDTNIGKEYHRGFLIEKNIEKTGFSKELYKYVTENIVNLNNEPIDIKVLYNQQDNMPEELELIGKKPESENEIVISSKLEKELGVGIGNSIDIMDSKRLVTGIVDSNEYFCILCRKAFVYDVSDVNRCAFVGVDVTLSANKNEYAEAIEVAGKAGSILDDAIIMGRKPEKENEIMISDEKAAEACGWPERSLLENCRLFNLYADAEGMKYSESINLFDFCGNSVRIVGVYSVEKQGENKGNVIFEDEVYHKILNYYIDYFSYEGIIVLRKYDLWKDALAALYNNNILAKEPEVRIYYDFMEATCKVKREFIVAIIVINLMLAISLLLLVSNVVIDNKKRVGILRALGVTRKEIISHFAVPFLAKALSIGATALSFALGGMGLLNGFVQDAYNDSELIIFRMHWNVFWRYPAIVVVFSLCTFCIPLLFVLKKRIICLIK